MKKCTELVRIAETPPMDEHWTTSPHARHVLQYGQDTRPAWLWSQDGQHLLWSNGAAALFRAKRTAAGLERAAPAVPIKGQIGRLLRLGAPGRSSMARLQFTAGGKPLSATCTIMPLPWAGDETALLIVALDPIAPDILAAQEDTTEQDANQGDAPPQETPHQETPHQETPQPEAAEQDAPVPAAETDEDTDWRQVAVDAPEETGEPVVRNEGNAESAALTSDAPASDEPEPITASDPQTAPSHDEAPFEPAEGGPEMDAAETADVARDDGARDEAEKRETENDATEGDSAPENPATLDAAETRLADISDRARRLSTLVDRLAATDALYTPLPASDDFASQDFASQDFAPEDSPSPLLPSASEPPETRVLYRVIGRGFAAEAQDAPASQPVENEAHSDEAPRDAEAMERVSRYNFDELSRILSDRVGERGQSEPDAETQETEETQEEEAPVSMALPAADAAGPVSAGSGALVNLGGETLVLNRLPLGILVFRDQNIVFANRAITEMVGYDSVESLRQAGLSAVFPGGEDDRNAGPINHLVQRDGALVPVTARLQSVSWQGRPALMLSASTTEVRTGHEEAVRAFARALAELRGDGFFETGRSGMINTATSFANALLGRGKTILGQSLANLIDDPDALRAFLERPARYAETERPVFSARSADGKADVVVFTQGQAGVISGYFGLVQAPAALASTTSVARPATASEIDPALLARISRGVRRSLNTIIGFADLLRAEAFGASGNEKYETYAHDIAAAGQDIAALADELDDYARLREGRYVSKPASLGLTELLESCVRRIRVQANGARVIVRNAISETLPRVVADRASLAQAVLNLLASAIDQSPTGRAVVISAQRLDNGGIAVHVRDSSHHAVDMAERFVVFRDGVNAQGRPQTPVRSSVGLALTRALLAVNNVKLSVGPAGQSGLLFSLTIPADLVDAAPAAE